MSSTTVSRWADALSATPSEGAIFLAGCSGEPTAFLDALGDDPDIGRGREFRGAWIPGVNGFDPTARGEGATASVVFATPALQEGIAAGRIRTLPMHYSAAYQWFRSGAGLSAAVFQVSSPLGGKVSLGVAADFVPALVEAKVALIGQVNPEMPFVANSPQIPVERFAALVEASSPLVEYDAGTPSKTLRRIAEQVAELIRPGDTVQFGLGKLQPAVIDALTGTDDLAIHSGMVSDAVLTAMDKGGITRGATAGVALGSRGFYDRVAEDHRFRFAPVSQTHDVAVTRALPNFVSVNTVLEVDLYGQCNGEFVAGQQITGHGGLIDFIRGANASAGGRSILALPSTADKGRKSRIVARLDPTNPVTVARSDVRWVVTEHGRVDLGLADADQRAERLITIADPAFRDSLADGWDQIRQRRRPE